MDATSSSAFSAPVAAGIPGDQLPVLSRSARRRVFNDSLANGLPYVLAGASIVYLALTAGHYFALQDTARDIMMITAGLSSSIFILMLSLYRRHNRYKHHAHLLGALVMLLIAANSLLHLAVTGDARQTSNLALLLVGAGSFLLSLRGWSVIVCVTVGGWVLLAMTRVSQPDWLHNGFMLFLAGVLSATIIGFRRTSIIDNEQLRLANQGKIIQLQGAFAEIRTLERFLPICAWCKSVRDESGQWQSPAVYLARQTSATLTHGMCPECAVKEH